MPLTGNVIDVQKIQLTDTFQTWFAKTNEIVDALNPVNIYDIDNGAGTNVTYGVTGTAYNGVKYVNVNAGYGVAVGGGSAKPWTGVVGLDISSISGNAYTLTGNESLTAGSIIASEVGDNDYFVVLDTSDTTQGLSGTTKVVRAKHMMPRTVFTPQTTFRGNVVIDGDFTVNGAGSSIAANVLSVNDKFIYLATTGGAGSTAPASTAPNLLNAGIVIGISGGTNKEIVWNYNINNDYITFNTNYGAKSASNALVNSKFIARDFITSGSTANTFIFEAAGSTSTRMWFTESGFNPYFGIVKDTNSSNVNFNVYNGAGITSVAYIIAGATSQYTGVTANAFIRFANVDMVDGAHAATGASAWTIPVTDQFGEIYGERHNAGQIKRRFTQTSHGLTTGQAVAIVITGAAVGGVPGTITGAQANSTSTEAFGIVDRVISANEFSVTMKGYMDLSPNGLLGIGKPVTGQVYYLDWAVKGGLTTNTNVPQGYLYQPLFMPLGGSSGIVYGNEADVIFPFAQDQVYMRGMVPIGVIQPYAGGLGGLSLGLSGGSIPVSDVQYNDNWMPCDGRALTAAGFVDLFSLIGYTYSMRGVVTSSGGANVVIRPDRGTANLGSLGLGSLAGNIRVIKRTGTDSTHTPKVYSYNGLTADTTTITLVGLLTDNATIGSGVVVDILSPKEGSYFFAPDLRGKAPFGEYAPYGARGEGFSLTAGATGGTATGDGGLFTNYLIRAKRDSDAMILTGHNHDQRYLRKDVTDTVSPAGTTLNLQNVEIVGILGNNDNIGIGMSPLSKSNGFTGFALSLNRSGNFGTWVSVYNGDNGGNASAGYRANNAVGDGNLYLSSKSDCTFNLVTSDGCSGGIRLYTNGVTGPIRFSTNATERMRITPTGNVGIGTSTPTAKLQTIDTNNAARFGASNTNALTIGSGLGGSPYSGIGYNVNFDSGVNNQYFAVGADRTSLIRFHDGGFEFKGNATNGALSGTPFALTDYMTILKSGNVGIGTINPVEKLTIVSNTDGYTGGIVNSNTQSGSYLRITPLGTNHGVVQWPNSSVVFEGIPASSGNTIIGSNSNDLVFQTGGRKDRMRLLADGTLIHNGFQLPASPGTVGSISFVPSSVNPIYNRIVFGSADNTGYGLAIASQTTNTITDRLVIYDNGRINIPGASASTSTTTGALTVAGGVGIAGTLNVPTLNVSGLSKLTRLAVLDGTSDIYTSYRIWARAAAGSGAVIGDSPDGSVYGILAYNNSNSFLGLGVLQNNGALINTGLLTNNGGITATGSITPGAWANGSAAKSYIFTAAPTTTNMPISGSVAYIV